MRLDLNEEGDATVWAAVEFYRGHLSNWLEVDKAQPRGQQMPAEMRRLFEQRIGFCKVLERQFQEERIGALIERSNGHQVEQPPAEPKTPRRRRAKQEPQFDGT